MKKSFGPMIADHKGTAVFQIEISGGKFLHPKLV
jgi:hypothetical protein